MLVRREGMECWMRQKRKPAKENADKENAGKGGGNGLLNEREGKDSKGECWWGRENVILNEIDRRRMLARAEGMECWMREKERPAKENAGMGGGNGMLTEREGKACKGECWWERREWNAEWERWKGQPRRMLVWAEGIECWMREKERPAQKNAGVDGGNGMLN
jgi:hypothetical protein